MISVGDAFLIHTPPDYSTPHLYIIIAINNESALMVNITTYNTYHDCTCMLERGEHPFITHKSIVNYVIFQNN